LGLVVTIAEPLLELSGIDFAYGPLQVLFGVSLTVPEGGRVALLGTNGAGKSTLLRVAAGLERPLRGTVCFAGREVTRLAAEDRVRLGMALVEGGRATFPSLSVRQNLGLGTYAAGVDRRTEDRRLEEVLDLFPSLRPRLGQRAGTLSGGEQQMMAIGRVLMAAPRLLMIDELSLGLAPVVMQEIVGAVERLVAAGVTLLLVEQSLNVALTVTELATFMEKGEVRFAGALSELVDRGDLMRSIFLGTGTAS
jgi:ABC-type branched-subunit amino acid transport system ATPase component